MLFYCGDTSVSFVADIFYYYFNSSGEFPVCYHVLHGIRKLVMKLQNIRQKKCLGWRRICDILMSNKCCADLQYCKQYWILSLILVNWAVAMYRWMYDTLCLYMIDMTVLSWSIPIRIACYEKNVQDPSHVICHLMGIVGLYNRSQSER